MVCYNSYMEETTDSAAVTLEVFSDRVGCHFTTASRLRAGERLPSRRLLGRIVKEYGIDRNKAFDAFTAGPEAFGALLREFVFKVSKTVEDGHDEKDQHVDCAVTS